LIRGRHWRMRYAYPPYRCSHVI